MSPLSSHIRPIVGTLNSASFVNILFSFRGSNDSERISVSTVLQIQVYPKKNAPEVSELPRVAKRDFLLILKIYSNLDDI